MKRFLFLDANHEPEAAVADVEAWASILKPGGLMCGHDFNLVASPIIEKCKELGWPEPERGPDQTWSTREPKIEEQR